MLMAMPRYTAHLEAAGFLDVRFEDVTPSWRNLTVTRYAKFVEDRASHGARL